MSILLSAVVLAGLHVWVPPQTPPRPPGLDAPVSFKVDGGPFGAMLDSIEVQTGLGFSLIAGLLPANLKIPAITFAGPAAEGLDKVLGPLGLRWEVGELGGIVVMPKDYKHRSFLEWKEKHFGDALGAEVVEPDELGQKLGFRKGDVLIALNGERRGSVSDFYRGCVELPEDSEATFTVRRGTETFQVKVRLSDRARWGRELGLARVADAPDEWAFYQKGGHRSPAWDDRIRKAIEETRQHPDRKEPIKVLNFAVEAYNAGCRDPFLLELVTLNSTQFDASVWEKVRWWADPNHLRTDYDGTMALARARMYARFLVQGPPVCRNEARRLVEAAWTALKSEPHSRQRRIMGWALAAYHFMEGRYEDCVRLMKSLEEHYLKDPDVYETRLHLQALCRLGRFDEAIDQHSRYQREDADTLIRAYGRLLVESKKALEERREPPRERLTEAAGLVAWKAHSAVNALEWGVAGNPLTGRPAVRNMDGKYSKGIPLPPAPFHDEAEIHLFVLAHRGYGAGVAKAGAVFGAQPRGGNLNPGQSPFDVFAGSHYLVMPRLLLVRKFGRDPAVGAIPVVAFSNDGADDFCLYKSGDTVTVRSNGAWITTDVSSNLALPGTFLMYFDSILGSVDAGVLIPTKRCYDNDRIRELMERVIDPKEKLTPAERLKLMDEASLLAPPSNAMKALRSTVPEKLRKDVSAPVYPADAPPLEELTVAQAAERFEKRGPVRWTRQDPEEPDTVWCARPDGTLERMSRLRYWTTTDRYVRDFSSGMFPRGDVAVGAPLFLKDSLWFPTDRGLYQFDRKAQIFRRVIPGGVFHDVPVTSLTLQGNGILLKSPRGNWRLDLKRGDWTREP